MKHLWLMALMLCAAQAGAQQAVAVSSLDVRAGQPLQMPGLWFPTRSAAPAPAMVLLHGCGGAYGPGRQLSTRFQQYAERLNGWGIHVLITDSLTPRGEKELCTQRIGTRGVTQTQRRRDALGALQWLAQQAAVDPNRTGLMGWSNGGSTVLASINQSHPEVRDSAVVPALAVAFYPGCESDLKRGYESRVPLLMLVGEADDWTPAQPCKQLAAVSPSVQIESYAGAYHGFDSTAPVRLRRDVPNGVHPGQGVHVGGNPEANAASTLRLEAFLRQQWQLAQPQ